MTDIIQYIIIGLIVGLAGRYLIKQIFNTFKSSKDGCVGGCGCAATELKKQKK
jgi:uncharacterized membrane protein YeaQ/YmgE (transglycosylase-associated protein family)